MQHHIRAASRVSEHSSPEKLILGEVRLLFAPGNTSKVILTGLGGPLEVGVAFSTTNSTKTVVRLSRIIRLDNRFQRPGTLTMLYNVPTSRGPPDAVRMHLVCPGANNKRTFPRILFSGVECSETRSLALRFKSTSLTRLIYIHVPTSAHNHPQITRISVRMPTCTPTCTRTCTPTCTKRCTCSCTCYNMYTNMYTTERTI